MIEFAIKDLSFTYPLRTEKALNNINLTAKRGEFITICGKSGCGKSTLLRNIKPAICQDSTNVGFVVQNPESQQLREKVWAAMAFNLEEQGLESKSVKLRVAEMASFFGIEAWYEKSIKELSGGQRQMLNLASVMVMQPDILILDEPTAQLDPIASSEFLETVGKINREIGTTVIITEHRLDEVLSLSDRAIVMDKGQIIVDDVPANVGAVLAAKNHDMFAAMPAPLQAYGKLYEDGYGRELECPVTVRDGRKWLTQILTDTSLSYTALPQKEIKKFDKKNVVLKAKEIWFRYNRNSEDLVKGLTLEVYKGELFTILGGNGTGKTTALKVLSGEKTPYRGKLTFGSSVGFMKQNPMLMFGDKSLNEEFEEITLDKERIEKMSNLLEINELLTCKIYELSGGEQQRGALAKILLQEPEIILLDEPTKGLDSHFKNKLAQILIDLKDNGTAIVMVSHDIEFCGKYADRCAMFFDGNIVTVNTPNKFFSGNSFYTTAANRMSRHIFENAITSEDIVELCKKNIKKHKTK